MLCEGFRARTLGLCVIFFCDEVVCKGFRGGDEVVLCMIFFGDEVVCEGLG